MLRDPFLNEEFQPDLMWFIGVFDVYDREETRGAELEVFNPNDRIDRTELIKRYSLNLGCLSYRHKLVLMDFLAEKLNDASYDFQSLFDIDEEDAGSWPRGEWYALADPRGFLQDFYTLAQEAWKEDVLLASFEDRASW
ncbi:hypothetical protein [Pseudomonas sp. FSL W5-0299]|uniref:hypothetical protein n=1 Tax=Pseudomonas sp. FSL W5-0299 TaxID=1917484 RepID=UPI0009CFDFA0|nr:hypothetical protein [Pseudomonas sp. FSL W5-0299]OOL39308.1 hypothetical protein BOO94_05090 [Pseudomonas sp. FSL W5-0299]